MAHYPGHKKKKELWRELGMSHPFSGAGFSSPGTYMPRSTGMGSPIAGTYLPSGQHHIDVPAGQTIPLTGTYEGDVEAVNLGSPLYPTTPSTAAPTQAELMQNMAMEQDMLSQGYVLQDGDFAMKYQDVNPYIFSQLTGEPDRRGTFDEQIDLLSAQHPNFAEEYAATGQGAIWNYANEDLASLLGQAHEYYNNPNFGLMPGALGITPSMIDNPYGPPSSEGLPPGLIEPTLNGPVGLLE